jgi:hypothetical protein
MGKITWMPTKVRERVDLLQGTLDLIGLAATIGVSSMGSRQTIYGRFL